MDYPRFNINAEILKNIGLIEAAREVIGNAPMVPAWEAKFRDDAKLRMAHYGTVLEGNDLTLNEARVVVEKGINNLEEASEAGIVARERDVQEVINYRKVIDLVEQLHEAGKAGGEFVYTQELLLKIHKIVVDRVVVQEVAGNYRNTQVVLRNSKTQEIGYKPPHYQQVPFLMEWFIGWLNDSKAREEHPVLRAGIAHYLLAAIHPFVEGNGRTSRAFATLVMFAEGYDFRKFFALEEYFDKHAEEYFGALMEVSNQTPIISQRDLTSWLAVFTRALALELTRIKEKVRELSVDIKIKERMGQQVQLSERQMKIVEYLNANGEVTMAEAKGILPMVSEDTILRDMRYLMDRGVVIKRGSTKAAKYALKK